MSEYDPVAKAQDATAFANSRFGKHYLALLTTVRDGHYQKARQHQKDGKTDLAVAEIARADEADGFIDYFTQAQIIIETPSMMKKMMNNFKARTRKEGDEKSRQDD